MNPSTDTRKPSSRLREYLSLSSSFSRRELALAIAILLGIAVTFAALREAFPDVISDTAYRWSIYSLYPIWGIALGKRSRDLGTTFTYGMLLGMLFPVIGVVFLFQAGKKSREQKPTESA